LGQSEERQMRAQKKAAGEALPDERQGEGGGEAEGAGEEKGREEKKQEAAAQGEGNASIRKDDNKNKVLRSHTLSVQRERKVF